MSADRTAFALSREGDAAAALVADLCTDDAELMHDMIEGETGLMEAIDAAIDEIDQCEIIAAGCKAKAAEIVARQHRAERRIEHVRALIERAMLMAELRAVKRPTATISLKPLPPRAIVTDESLVPSEFWEPQPPRLDKAALNAAAKDRGIPGVEMSYVGSSLQIRRG